jgi:hypothetical protein
MYSINVLLNLLQHLNKDICLSYEYSETLMNLKLNYLPSYSREECWIWPHFDHEQCNWSPCSIEDVIRLSGIRLRCCQHQAIYPWKNRKRLYKATTTTKHSVKLKYLISHTPIVSKSAQAPFEHISPGKRLHTKQPQQTSSNIKLTMGNKIFKIKKLSLTLPYNC